MAAEGGAALCSPLPVLGTVACGLGGGLIGGVIGSGLGTGIADLVTTAMGFGPSHPGYVSQAEVNAAAKAGTVPEGPSAPPPLPSSK